MAVPVGIQLYSVREALAADPEGTLATLADLGFRLIEGANHQASSDDGIGFGFAADELAGLLNRHGLTPVGCHINPLALERLPRILDFHQSIGNTAVGCDIEFYPYGDLDYVLRRADTFNEIGSLCAERGMEFYYHNHYQEFQEFGGKIVYETLLDNTDPELVKVEMDTYWVYRGGHDPLEWIARYPDRVIMVHQKDFPSDSPQPLDIFDGVVDRSAPIDLDVFMAAENPRAFTEVGQGILPIQDIVHAVSGLPNFRCLLVETDYSVHEDMDSVRLNRTGLQALDGIHF